jgi:electron transfer flavoprotein beta subunit
MIAVCIKWVDARPDVDPLTGEVRTDARTSGASDADNAALEWALRAAQQWETSVVAVTAGPTGAEAVLRDALAAGAASAVHVVMPAASPSDAVADSIASALGGDADLVVCGAWSVDRGSGSVPAFLAARLGAAQALGLISLSFDGRRLRAERRLDRGRRELVSMECPAVISVEAGSARLRRAPLPGVVQAHLQSIVSVEGSGAAASSLARTIPLRPRPRVLAAPAAGLTARERILSLTGALVDHEPPQRLVLDPPAAADRIIEQLRAWGYLA